MKKMRYLFFTLIVALSVFSVNGQSLIDLRLNEILINNRNNVADEYGQHPAWVEIFNTAYNSVNVGGCYLTNDTTGLAAAKESQESLNAFKNKPNMYNIPAGDPATLMDQRSCLIFYMDGKPTYGTFHVSFTPENSHYVALIGSDGKTLIDIMVFPDELFYSDKSYGCELDGVVANNRDNSVLAKKDNEDVRTFLDFFTPGSNNQIKSAEGKADKLAKDDPYGIMMALISISIVFSVLAIIFLVLKVFAHFSAKEQKKAAPKAEVPVQKGVAGGKPTEEELAAIALALDKSCASADEEEIAAIGMALYLYLDTQHDEESEVITFGNAADYSTWGQKHFNFKRNPRR